MSVKALVSALVLVMVMGGALLRAASDAIPAERGEIRITPIVHGSVQVEFDGTVIYVDP